MPEKWHYWLDQADRVTKVEKALDDHLRKIVLSRIQRIATRKVRRSLISTIRDTLRQRLESPDVKNSITATVKDVAQQTLVQSESKKSIAGGLKEIFQSIGLELIVPFLPIIISLIVAIVPSLVQTQMQKELEAFKQKQATTRTEIYRELYSSNVGDLSELQRMSYRSGTPG